MKKIIVFLMIAGLMASCYDDFRLDYEHSTVAFSYVTGGSNVPGVLWRTVAKDEGLKLDAGIYLAGYLENTEDRWADYIIDETLLDGTSYTLMPESYYTLSNESRFVIPIGSLIGRVTITLDSTQFVNDELATSPNYAIPFRLTNTSVDSVLSTQSTQILVIKYINHFEGFYQQEGSFSTEEEDGKVLNSGGIDNVLELSTILLDSVETDGLMYLNGADYKMKLHVNADNSVSLAYSPNMETSTDPVNIALDASPTTSSVSDWEDVTGINDGYQPANSADKGDKAYGNWPNAMIWNWVQYDLPSLYYLSQSDVYWWTDGGGILIPFNSYVECWDLETEEWVVLNDPEVNGVSMDASNYGVTDTLIINDTNPNEGGEVDQWNITKFSPILTNKIRLNFIARESQGILEWQVWGLPGAAGLEMRAIESITPNGSNTYDPSTGTLDLNYTVNYALEDYHTDVSSSMVWRNRIRDGVNEWRR